MRKLLIVVGVCAAVAVGPLLVVTEAKAATLEDGFTAICKNISGQSNYGGDWGKSGFSKPFKIIYDGGKTFRVAGDSFNFEVLYKTKVKIAGVGTFRESIYTLRISTETNEMTYTRLVETGIGETISVVGAYVGKCEIKK